MIGPSVMDTSPAFGEVTAVVTGSAGVGPVPGSVVRVPPAGTVSCLVWVRNWIEMPICLLSKAWVVNAYADSPEVTEGVMFSVPEP